MADIPDTVPTVLPPGPPDLPIVAQAPPPIPPNRQEIATILVDDKRFEEFETVWVQHRWTEGWPLFRFTTADIMNDPRLPAPDNWTKLQFKPGDVCAIYLGDVLAVTGVITVRQTAYDAENKGVSLQGVGLQWFAARASVVDKTGSFDGMSWMAIMQRICAPTGIEVKPVGTPNPLPFEHCQVEKGETIWNFAERLARVRGIVVGSDHLGHFLGIGDHVADIVADLVEGINIKKMQAIVSIEGIFSEYIIDAQTAAKDSNWGKRASEIRGWAKGSAKRYSPLLTPAEQPVWNKAEADDRANNEAGWHEYVIVQATVVVQGWIKPGTFDLWRVGTKVRVWSPL